MKTKVFKSEVHAPKKSIKLLCHLKKEPSNDSWEKAFENSFDDDINVLDGSFSKLKPIGAPRLTTSKNFVLSSSEAPRQSTTKVFTPSSEEPRPSTSKDFMPLITSTPIYEDVSASSDDEDGEEKAVNFSDDCDNDLNETFNFKEDIESERVECQKYLNLVQDFLKKNDEFISRKNLKKVQLHQKLRKYEKKANKVRAALQEIEQAINFGIRIPKVMDGASYTKMLNMY